MLAQADLLDRFAAGDLLPQALTARFDWRPVVKSFEGFTPNGDRNLLLSVEAGDGSRASTRRFR